MGRRQIARRAYDLVVPGGPEQCLRPRLVHRDPQLDEAVRLQPERLELCRVRVQFAVQAASTSSAAATRSGVSAASGYRPGGKVPGVDRTHLGPNGVARTAADDPAGTSAGSAVRLHEARSRDTATLQRGQGPGRQLVPRDLGYQRGTTSTISLGAVSEPGSFWHRQASLPLVRYF